MHDLVVLAASAAVVALMVGVAFALGFRDTAKLDSDMMARLASEESAGVEAAVIDSAGRAGVALLSDGRVLIARVMGGDVGVRVAQRANIRVRLRGNRLSVTAGDLGFPALNMSADSIPAEIAALAQQESPQRA